MSEPSPRVLCTNRDTDNSHSSASNSGIIAATTVAVKLAVTEVVGAVQQEEIMHLKMNTDAIGGH